MIFDLQRYSTHDGPGIRTLVFLKGCSLACLWCQNPESRSPKPDILLDRRQCIEGCQLCSQTCPAILRDSEGIQLSRSALKADDMERLRGLCPSEALQVCGRDETLDTLMDTILRDRPFFERSGGGVTLSGGEPFMQPDFAAALLARCKAEGLHTAVESCLHVPWHQIEPSLPSLDLVLADLKHVDKERFFHWTAARLSCPSRTSNASPNTACRCRSGYRSFPASMPTANRSKPSPTPPPASALCRRSTSSPTTRWGWANMPCWICPIRRRTHRSTTPIYSALPTHTPNVRG